MSNYFRNFPLTNYYFGDEKYSVLFQKINAYIDLLDQAKNLVTAYQYHNILEYERPDTVSMNLYGTPNYGWTFFLLNDNIRLQGWPVDNLRLYTLAESYYPNIVVTTTQNVGYTQNVKVGDTVSLFSDPAQTGKVVKIDQELGQIYIERDSLFSKNSGYIISVDNPLDINLAVPFTSQLAQGNAIHHWENDSGEYQDILDSTGKYIEIYGDYGDDEEAPWRELVFKSTVNLTPVTYVSRLRDINESLKRIKVIKPESIEAFVTEFNRLLQAR